MLIGNLLLSRNKDRRNAAPEQPSGCRRTRTPIGKIDVHQRSVKFQTRKFFLQIGKTFKTCYENISQILKELFYIKYYKRIVL